MRPIDADALYEFITKRYSDLKGGSYPFNYVAFDMARLVEKAPTIDAVEVRHGEWVLVFPRRTGRNATYRCSVCNKLRSSYYNDVKNWEYCPCGAKMDGERIEK